MKIVMVNGQNHKGSTYNIGRMLAGMLGEDNEITEFFLPKDMNHFCVGCYQCIDDRTKCPFYKEKSIIIDAMKEAELFIFTTPNYCLGPSGQMKAFLDVMFDYWMVHRPAEWMFKKKAVVISTTAGAGTSKAIKTVKDSLFYWGVPYIKSYGISVQAMNWAGVNGEKKEKITKDMTAIARKIKNMGVPHVGLKTRFLFGMLQKMHKSGWDSSKTEQKYWEDKGWLGKERPWN
ncbi:MAG: NAD(P)H-dependent oxidoreductase [Oscillospiraceae bacterium]|nr:NAD(P)H-dependent oxidoreductase [Oscillospiraceae bacterium]